jgi:hypothetical protein
LHDIPHLFNANPSYATAPNGGNGDRAQPADEPNNYSTTLQFFVETQAD